MNGLDENYLETAWQHNLSQFRQSPKIHSLYTALFQPFDSLQKVFRNLLLNRHLSEFKTISPISDGVFYFGFAGQSRAKGFSQAVIRSRKKKVVKKSSATNDVSVGELINHAVGQQLDGIGDILGISRPYISSGGMVYFGFTGQSKSKGFSQATIRHQSAFSIGQGYQFLDDNTYRRLLHWKIIANNSHGTIEDIIKACQIVFMANRVVIQEERCRLRIYITREIKYANNAIESIKEKLIPASAGIFVSVNIIDG